MGIIVYSLSFLHLSALITLILQVPVGMIVYIIGSRLFHIESFEFIISVLKSFRKKKV